MTDPSPLVAIVTPVYNGETFLSEAMASVQAQTYPNLVHVVLDNASTDATPAIIERYRTGRVPIITARNPATLPIQQNWNAAMTLIPQEAQYFQLLCADDTFAQSQSIEKMVAAMARDPSVELVGCVRSTNDGVLVPTHLPSSKTVFDGAAVARAFLNNEANEFPAPFGLFRLHEAERAKPFFREDIYCNDMDASLRAVTRGKFAFVHEPLVMIRRHGGQVSGGLGAVRFAIENLILIRDWGPLVMTRAELRTSFARQRGKIYRLLALSQAKGRPRLDSRYLDLLGQVSRIPSSFDLVSSLFNWPLYRLNMVLRKNQLYRDWSGAGAA